MPSKVSKAFSTLSNASAPKPKILPLGYKWVDGKIQIDPQQAERIREIFRRYAAKE